MRVTLSLTSSELVEDQIQQLTREICTSINKEVSGAEATLAEGPGSTGTKGDQVSIGTVLVTLIGSGGLVVTLINVLRAYVDRSRRIKIKIKSEQGNEIEIDATNLSPTQIGETTKMINKLLGRANE